MAKGTLIAAMNMGRAAEDEFNDWYDTEHVPERSRVAGFLNCQRWIGADDANVSVATYDLCALSVLQSPAYRAIAYENLSPWSKRVVGRCERLLRFEGSQTLPGDAAAPGAAQALLLNAMNAAPEHEADFNRWYDEEHIPALAAVPWIPQTTGCGSAAMGPKGSAGISKASATVSSAQPVQKSSPSAARITARMASSFAMVSQASASSRRVRAPTRLEPGCAASVMRASGPSTSNRMV